MLLWAERYFVPSHTAVVFPKSAPQVTFSTEAPRVFLHSQASSVRRRAQKAFNPPPERLAAKWIPFDHLGGVVTALFITATVRQRVYSRQMTLGILFDSVSYPEPLVKPQSELLQKWARVSTKIQTGGNHCLKTIYIIMYSPDCWDTLIRLPRCSYHGNFSYSHFSIYTWAA